MSIKIWQILEGPMPVEDFDGDIPDEDCVTVAVCQAEINGELVEINYWFEDPEDSLEWQHYFANNIEPLVVEDFDDKGLDS